MIFPASFCFVERGLYSRRFEENPIFDARMLGYGKKSTQTFEICDFFKYI
jgi:hypothetical protein